MGIPIDSERPDPALEALLCGVPSLVVDFENKKQVFVESNVDERIYGIAYEVLSTNEKYGLTRDIVLLFICAGKHPDMNNSNCEQVKDVVKKLRSAGNRSAFGVIDWDKRNSGGDGIFVCSENLRYSVENIVYDPLVLCVFLILENVCTLAEMGLAGSTAISEIMQFDQAQLQKMTNFVIDAVRTKLVDSLTTDATPVQCFYVDGRSLNYPAWYLRNV